MAPRLAPAQDLQPLLLQIILAVQARFPQMPIPAEAFLDYLVERLPPDGDAMEALRAVHAADLYLACGCARGATWAIAEFERSVLSQVPLFLARSHPEANLIEEVTQVLRMKLLVGTDGGPARIASRSPHSDRPQFDRRSQ